MPGSTSADSTGVRIVPSSGITTRFAVPVSATPPSAVAKTASGPASRRRSAHLCRQLPAGRWVRDNATRPPDAGAGLTSMTGPAGGHRV
ncbi:MAG TPA: hypothetical protein VFU36_02715, partial [Jatrophihabitans sp.]|nr:hypothetical protein [Jatrophihabitans sp.]